MRDIAAALGERYGVPSGSIPPHQAEEHFGWLGRFAAMDAPATAPKTRETLGWAPTGPTLLEDIAAGGYDEARAGRATRRPARRTAGSGAPPVEDLLWLPWPAMPLWRPSGPRGPERIKGSSSEDPLMHTRRSRPMRHHPGPNAHT